MTVDEKKAWQEEMRRQFFIVLGNFFILLVIFAAGYILSYFSFWRWWMSVIWITFLLVLTGCIFIFKFALEGIYITIVEEGTGQVKMRLGQAVKGFIQYKGKTLRGPDWDVVSGQEKHHLGGLRVVGLWPISYIYKYKLGWTSVKEDGSPISHVEELNSVLLKEKTYYMKIEEAEDRDGIPVTFDVIITGRVVKIYKALFSPQDYLEQTLSRVRPFFGQYVRKYSFMELRAQSQRGGGELWEAMEKIGMVNTFDEHGDVQVVGEFERDYGFQVKDGGIEIKNVTPPPEYQQAQTRKRLAETEAERISGETILAVINMMAVSKGVALKDMQDQINTSPKLQKEFRGRCWDTFHKKMAIDGGSYVKIDVSGAGGTEKTLMDLAAAWLRMPQGKRGGNQNQESLEGGKKKKLTLEEQIAEMERFQKEGGRLDLGSGDSEEDEEE